ncbi:MAG: PGPGW domain-containing protein [Terrabacter sp.]
MTAAAKRIGLEVAGWGLLLIGIAAIPLPGPGLLGVFAGLYLLSQQYEWADKRVEPVKMKALLGAAQGVESWPKIVLSVLAALVLAACGVFWIIGPEQPSWWPLPDLFWLPGGIWTGITQVASAIFALGFIVYSYRRYHGNDEEIQALKERVDELSSKD